MNIVEQGAEYSKRDIYILTKSPKIEKMSNHVGEKLSVDKYIIYEDGDNRETPVQILSIQSGELVVATNSVTAIKEFNGIRDLMEDEPFSVEIMTGNSKNGRTYLTLALA